MEEFEVEIQYEFGAERYHPRSSTILLKKKKKKDSKEKAVKDVAANGFRIEDEPGVFTHISPHRILKIVYEE